MCLPIRKTATKAGLDTGMALILLVLGAIAMGVSPVFVRYSEVDPFASAFWRVLLALPLLYLWAWYERPKDNPDNSKRIRIFAFPHAVLLSGLFFAGDLIFWHLAIVNTTMANATLMACLAPVWVALFSGGFIGEKVSGRSWAGLIICLIGAACLIGSSFRFAPERLIGDFYGLVTSIFFGLYFLAIRVARRQFKSGQVTFNSTLVTAIFLFIAALTFGRDFFPDSFSGVASLIMLGSVSHAGGQGLLSIALGVLSAAFSSLVIFVEALAGAFFGWLIFDEKMGPLQLTGAVLIICGIVFARPKQRR